MTDKGATGCARADDLSLLRIDFVVLQRYADLLFPLLPRLSMEMGFWKSLLPFGDEV